MIADLLPSRLLEISFLVLGTPIGFNKSLKSKYIKKENQI